MASEAEDVTTLARPDGPIAEALPDGHVALPSDLLDAVVGVLLELPAGRVIDLLDALRQQTIRP